MIHVGDLVGKGPKPVEVVQYCIDSGACGVMGNHDHQLLLCAYTMGLIKGVGTGTGTGTDTKLPLPLTHRGTRIEALLLLTGCGACVVVVRSAVCRCRIVYGGN